MEDQTMIKIERDTVDILKRLRLVERESYNEVIKRILEDYLENHLELSEEMKERIKTLENIKKEDMLSSDEALAYLKNIKKKSK
jgi:DNA-binding FrmR family transcriptional regulator